MKPLLAIVALGLISGRAILAEDAPKNDRDAILGTWVCVSGEESGVTLKTAKGQRLTVTAQEMTYASDKEQPKPQATYKVDSGKSPKQITLSIKSTLGDLTLDTFAMGIYQVDGDELKLCWDMKGPGSERPKEFKTASGSNTQLMIYNCTFREKLTFHRE